VLALWAPWRSATPPRVTRTTITTSGPAALTISGIDRDLALSPDGTHVVYVGNSSTQIFVRALDALEPVAIASGGDVRGPFVSPARRDTPGDAAAANDVRRTLRDRLARRPVAGVRVQQFGIVRIYVQPFPNVGGGQRQVSTAGGTRPLWARSGRELFYVGADRALRRVPVEASGTTWNAGTPGRR
jgi:hypothetical protein